MLKLLGTLMPKKRRRPVIIELGNGTEATSKPDKRGLASNSATVLMLVLVAGTCTWFTMGQRLPDGVTRKHQEPKVYGYSIAAEFEHSPEAFTQGLEFDRACSTPAGGGAKVCEDVYWESTGLNGESSLREVSLTTGVVRRKKDLDAKHFAEGVTKLNGRLYQITWRSNNMISTLATNFDDSVDLKTPLKDGWGICTDGKSLILSDSSAVLSWLHPDSLALQRTITVHDGDVSVPWINELEWVKGEIWANVWQTECIARISPADGRIIGWIHLKGITRREREAHPKARLDVLNGIAWDGNRKKLYITGKWWHSLYQIELVSAPAGNLQATRSACIPSGSTPLL